MAKSVGDESSKRGFRTPRRDANERPRRVIERRAERHAGELGRRAEGVTDDAARAQAELVEATRVGKERGRELCVLRERLASERSSAAETGEEVRSSRTRSTDYLDGDDAGVGRVRVQRWAPFAPLPRTYSIAALPPPAATAAEYKDSDNIIMMIINYECFIAVITRSY